MALRNFVVKLGMRAAKSDRLWSILDPLLFRPCRMLERHRKKVVDERNDARLARQLFPDLNVMNGPFAELIYPSAHSVCSAILPKLLGSYEQELQSDIEKLLKNDYALVADIGCAEGYYAVGIARRLPKCHVWAFDIDSEAQLLCAEMIAINQVQDRVHLEGECTSEKLRRLFGDSRGLIVSDCEAFEFQLFDRPCIESLSNCDLVIECHELLRDDSLPDFIERFQATHSTHMIESIEDFRKARTYEYPQINNLSLEERQRVVAEHRPWTMKWLIARSKKTLSSSTP